MRFTSSFQLRRITTHLIASLIILMSGWQHAAAEQDTRWYDVEVIIFKQNSQEYRESEVWPKDISLPDMANTRQLASSHSRTSFKMLKGSELKLKGEAARIKAAPELEMLLHLGWRQPGLSQNKAISVPIYDGMLEGKRYRKAGTDAFPHRLEGTLKLVLSRYLHINTDLLYREPLTAGAQSTESGESLNDALTPQYRLFQMQQSRRMRSNELHYLDHPVLGMVVRVTPYKNAN